MTGAIKRLSKLTTIVMAAILCVTLLPISVKANQVPESITITRADMNVAMNDFTEEKGYGINEEKGILFAEPRFGNGLYVLYEPTEYILGENINLNKEAFIFDSIDESLDLLPATLNLNNKTLNFSGYLHDGGEYLGAVNIYSRECTIKGEGIIACISDPSSLAVDNYGELIIESGTFNGFLRNYNSSIVNGGNYNGIFYTLHEMTINDGVFNANLVSAEGNLTINNGLFYGTNYFYSEDNLDSTVVINGGRFVYENRSPKEPTIDVENVKLIVNGGYIENKTVAESEDDTPSAIYAYKYGDELSTSVIINGGTIKGGGYDYGISLLDCDYVEINGGDISGYLGALSIQADDLPNLSLSGGKFTTYGPDEPYIDGAISFILPSDKYIENAPDDYFDYALAEGYQFKPKAEINNKGIDPYDDAFRIGTQKDIEVIPESKVVSDQDNDSLLTEVSAIVNQIKKGEIPEGVSAELAQAIVAALADGKDIDVEMTVTAVNPEDIKDETKAIAGLVTNTENIAGYYDIKVAVSIDGEVKGFITKFADGVLISLPEPEGLPPLAAGYERVFSFIRIHDGVATKLPAQLKDGVINSYSDSYSIYALVYEDVKTAPDYDNTEVTPQTGDKGAVLWIVLASAFAAAGAVTFVYKKNKVEE